MAEEGFVFSRLLGGVLLSLTWISEVRFCMIAQMSLVSLSVKLAALPGVLGALVSSMLGWMRRGWVDGWMNVRCLRYVEVFKNDCTCEREGVRDVT
jgi:hypothetical protein